MQLKVTKMISQICTVKFACCLQSSLVLLATGIDELDDDNVAFTRLAFYDILDIQAPWGYSDMVDWLVVSVALTHNGYRVCLSEEGQVRFFEPGGQPNAIFQLPDAGVFREGATGYGYVQRIRAIGQGLYV